MFKKKVEEMKYPDTQYYGSLGAVKFQNGKYYAGFGVKEGGTYTDVEICFKDALAGSNDSREAVLKLDGTFAKWLVDIELPETIEEVIIAHYNKAKANYFKYLDKIEAKKKKVLQSK